MSTCKTKKTLFSRAGISLGILSALVLLAICSLTADADPAPPVPYPGGYSNGDVNDNVYNPGVDQPPPVGSGSNAPPVDAGDLGPALVPPTGTADKTDGSILNSQIGKDRTIVRLYVNGEEVQTIRPDQLTDAQIASIDGILGINMLDGEQTIKVPCSSNQIYEIQNVLYPYPANTLIGGKQKIVSDPAPQWITNATGARTHNPDGGGLEQQNSQLWSAFDYIGPLPTVRVFCRWLVTAGVVAATIWIASGAISLSLGHPMADMRIMQTILGLMVLLSGFTVYKIVQMNVWNATVVDASPNKADRTQQAQVNDQYMQVPDVPAVPTAVPQSPGRDGVPVAPLSEPTYQ